MPFKKKFAQNLNNCLFFNHFRKNTQKTIFDSEINFPELTSQISYKMYKNRRQLFDTHASSNLKLDELIRKFAIKADKLVIIRKRNRVTSSYGKAYNAYFGYQRGKAG